MHKFGVGLTFGTMAPDLTEQALVRNKYHPCCVHDAWKWPQLVCIKVGLVIVPVSKWSDKLQNIHILLQGQQIDYFALTSMLEGRPNILWEKTPAFWVEVGTDPRGSLAKHHPCAPSMELPDQARVHHCGSYRIAHLWFHRPSTYCDESKFVHEFAI